MKIINNPDFSQELKEILKYIANDKPSASKKFSKELKDNIKDSRNGARKKAVTKVKVLILEEIGVFVESYLELNSVVADKKYQKYFKEEIKNLTAGIIKTKILDEKFDGKSYYVKASVLVDPDSISEGISEILKIKANKSEINKLTKLLKSKEQEIDTRSNETIVLQKKVTKQELLNRAKEQELQDVKFKLQQAKQQLLRYKQDEINLNTELGRVQSQVQRAMQKIENQSRKSCLMRIGMTKQEVRSILGNPAGATTSYGKCVSLDLGSCTQWHYGVVTLYFQSSGLLSGARGCR